MKQISYSYNPFGLKAVDRLTPMEINKLFADPNCYSEATKIQHQFLIGARGSGKSMLLKRLTLSSVLQSQEDPPFLGIYFPVKLTSVEPYLRIWTQTAESAIFEHYFAFNILRSLDIDLSLIEETGNIRNQFASIARTCSPLLSNSSSLSEGIEDHLLSLGTKLTQLPRQQLTSIATLVDLLSKFASLWKTRSGKEIPVSLLIDNYQELGPLAFVINNMMRKEDLSSFCIKAAATTISGLWNQEGTIEAPEYHHDFEIVVVDNDPVDTRTEEFITAVVDNRLEVTGLTVPEVFSGFGRYKIVSSGNADCLCKLCERAWYLAHTGTSKKQISGPSISIDMQMRAAKSISKDYYEGEIPSKDKDFGPLLQSLVFNIVKSTSGTRFAVDQKETLPLQLINLLRKGVHKGIFQIAIDERKAVEISDTYCPQDLSIHHLVIPYLQNTQNLLDEKEAVSLTQSQLINWAFTKVPGQPEFYIPSQRSVQVDLWQQQAKAFISSPTGKRRPVFISRLRKAIFEARASRLQRIGVSNWPPKEENFVEDCYDIRRSIRGDFQYFIDERLTKSSFVVHDVTNLTPGVAYEIGFSRGSKKPSFMVWDIAQKSFNPDLLPDIISRGFHIHELNYKSTSFKNDVDMIIVDHALKYVGNIKCPRHWDGDCAHKGKQDKRDNIGFVYASKKYADLLQSELELKMRNHGIRRPQGEELPTENEFCQYHCAICQSVIALINYSLNDLDSAFLLGLAAGCKSYAIQLYDESERDNEEKQNRGLAMWGGKPVVQWAPTTLKFDLNKLNTFFTTRGK